ncbi:MAG TPA: HD domain-containing protein [Bacillota bacterium]|nr:HD domain-containing protein [Bacillota bacterium]HPJ86036.1 HD domain-containing protein [Bacillota bacterium]HPQ62021.1 HD domain-containing protein [Bacillota bacterium]HRX92422.1 HD domain-containing protein [Candidatus Izemoplasmatales bacterium]
MTDISLDQKQCGLLENAAAYVKTIMENDEPGHDFSHIERVVGNARKILAKEPADPFITLMVAYLHDLDDPKLQRKETNLAKKYLDSCDLDSVIKTKILKAISEISFSGQKNGIKITSKEAAIAQDADRLDALGAIGIARTFSFGGHLGRKIYSGRVDDDSSFAHFYQKLFLLVNLMNTKTAKRIAKSRTKYMKKYVRRLARETS